MTIELTTSEAAEHLGVPVGTLKGWLGKIPLPTSVDSAGRRRIGPEALELLERIRTLRLEEGRGMDTIRRRLGPAAAESSRGLEQDVSSSTGNEAETSFGRVGVSAEELTRTISEAVFSAVNEQGGLAEKYARATYTIGQLEERVAGLAAQLSEAKEKIALLEAPKSEPKRPWWKLF